MEQKEKTKISEKNIKIIIKKSKLFLLTVKFINLSKRLFLKIKYFLHFSKLVVVAKSKIAINYILNNNIIKRIFLFIVLGLISYLLFRNIDFTKINENIIRNYFISLGVLSGSVIAIVFTLITPALQKIINYLPTRYISSHLNGWGEKLRYFIIVSSVLYFFIIGLLVDDHTNKFVILVLLSSSIFIIGSIFIIVEWHYEVMRKKMSSDNFIAYIQKRSLKQLSKIELNAQQVINLFSFKDIQVPKNQALSQTYNTLFQPHFKTVQKDINDLLEIGMKFSGEKDYVNSKLSITSALVITRKYLKIKREGSISMPTGDFFLATTSDLQSFLTPILEKINNMGEIYSQENNRELALHVVTFLYNLSIESTNIKFNSSMSDNPAFSQIQGYLKMYLKYAFKKQDLDVIYECAKAYRDLAVITARKNYNSSLYGIQDTIFEIANHGLLMKYTFIADECTKAYLNIISENFVLKRMSRIDVSKALKYIKDISFCTYTYINNGYLIDDYSSRTTLTLGYDKLNYDIVYKIRFILFNKGKLEVKEQLVSQFVEFQKELYRQIRDLSENIESCDGLIIDSISRLLLAINTLSIELLDNKKLSKNHAELASRISWFTHLPPFFALSAKQFRSNKGFSELTEYLAKTGILLFGRGNDEIKIASIKSLYSIVNYSFGNNKESHGYDEPRIMLKICFIGILALKYDKQLIIQEIKKMISEFQSKFKYKYFDSIKLPKGTTFDQIYGHPKENQLKYELEEIKRNFISKKMNRRMGGIIDRAEDWLIEKIEEKDIELFIKEVFD